MKIFRFLIFFLVLSLFSCPVFANKPLVSADMKTYDAATDVYRLDGNVRVEWPGCIITCGHAQVRGGTMEFWAQEDIVLQQGEILFSCDELYFASPSRTSIMRGNCSFTETALSILSDSAVFNLDTNTAEFVGNVNYTFNDQEASCNRLVFNANTHEVLVE